MGANSAPPQGDDFLFPAEGKALTACLGGDTFKARLSPLLATRLRRIALPLRKMGEIAASL